VTYTDFSVLQLTQRFGVKFQAEELFPNLELVEPTDWLKETLRKGMELRYYQKPFLEVFFNI
jgi:hypothetical protein